MEPRSLLERLHDRKPTTVAHADALIATQPEVLFQAMQERYEAASGRPAAPVPASAERVTMPGHWENWAGKITATPERLFDLTHRQLLKDGIKQLARIFLRGGATEVWPATFQHLSIRTEADLDA